MITSPIITAQFIQLLPGSRIHASSKLVFPLRLRHSRFLVIVTCTEHVLILRQIMPMGDKVLPKFLLSALWKYRVYKENETELSRKSDTRTTESWLLYAIHSNLSSKLIPIAMPILPIWDWTLSSAPLPWFAGSDTISTEVDVVGITWDVADGLAVIISVIVTVNGVWDVADTLAGMPVAVGDVTQSMLVDVAGKELVTGTDDMLPVFMVGAEVLGKVIGGRVLQRALNSKMPNNTVSPVLRMKLNGGLAITIRFKYTIVLWIYQWKNTIYACLDFRVTFRSAETRGRGARLSQRCYRGTYICTLFKRVGLCPKSLINVGRTWSGIR